jgi:hypothetical protein
MCSDPDEDDETADCQDSIDNDGDNLIDMDDPGCTDENDNDESDTLDTECGNSIDDDNDGLVDSEDPGCWADHNDPLTYDPSLDDESLATSQCQDSIDNDGDGYSDYPSDFGCESPQDYSEINDGPYACNNGLDDDGDALFDQDDPMCIAYDDDSEFAECNDGLDNDDDSLVDSDDPGCSEQGAYDPNDDDEKDEFVITCYSDSDCGKDGFYGSTFCMDDNVYRFYRIHSCIDPGMSTSFCDTTDVKRLFESCSRGCKDGSCRHYIESVTLKDDLYISGIGFGIIDRFALEDEAYFSITLLNDGRTAVEDLSISVVVYDLGFYHTFGDVDLDDGEQKTKRTTFALPPYAQPGRYDVRIVISNDDIRRVLHRQIDIV